MIIGVSGKISSGKDTVGEIILGLTNGMRKEDILHKLDRFGSCHVNPHESDWKIKKYAFKIKEIISIVIGCDIHDLESEEFKNTPLGEEWQLPWRKRLEKPMTPRLMLQLLGTEWGRDLIHPNVWVNALMADYSPVRMDGKMPNWVVTDMRFPNEMEAIKQRGGVTIRVNRGVAPKTHEHPSETALDKARFDHIIDNNSDISSLVDTVEFILVSEGIL